MFYQKYGSNVDMVVVQFGVYVQVVNDIFRLIGKNLIKFLGIDNSFFLFLFI